MKSRIDSQIRNLVLEIILVVTVTIISIPLWNNISNETYADIADHYSNLKSSDVIITNMKKYIYSESYEEAINEMNVALITSHAETSGTHDIYLLLKPGTNYDDIVFSNGVSRFNLKDLYYDTKDYIYFKIDSKYLNPSETITYNYYIWSRDLNKDKNIKLKFAIL